MFNNFDSRKIAIILLIIGAAALMFGSTGGIAGLREKLLIIPGLILGLTIHEYSHAKMADRLGDPTPESQGRLTLNPLAHLDPVGSICLLFAGFGWGKPVQIDGSYFRNPAKDNMLVALAGPVSNILLTIALSILFLLVFTIDCIFKLNQTLMNLLLDMILNGALINLSLGIFNLLPFPPLDGSKILSYFLKGKAKEFIWTLERYSWIILMFLFITELPSMIISPFLSKLGSTLITLAYKIAAMVL
ncbi:MAG: site-2 protease family protein [Clostridia bacterium]|nr:site-2 protease family protein [Clostridia bacterium]